MSRIGFALAAAALTSAAPIQAQTAAPIKRMEIGVDMAVQKTRSHDLLQATNTPLSMRYGAVNSMYRLTIDQRMTIGERRLTDSPETWSLDTQLGWRLGSRSRLNRSVLGPYLFGAFNLTSKSAHFRDASAPSGPLFGYAAGIGTRVMVRHMVLRPELFMAYDPGVGARNNAFWIPARSSFGFRLGYGWQIPIANE